MYVCIYRGVVAKQYKELREGIRRIVVNTLFDPTAVSKYFSGQRKYAIEMLHLGELPFCSTIYYSNSVWCLVLGPHFGGLLDSPAANTIVEKKIDSALAGPEGRVTYIYTSCLLPLFSSFFPP